MAQSVSHAGTLLSFAAALSTQHVATLQRQCAPQQVFALADLPIPDVWEDFVTVLEREGFIGPDECFACGATRDPEHESILTHARTCTFDRIDRAMSRLRAEGGAV